MQEVAYLECENGRRLAYQQTPARGRGTDLPDVVFLGGFKSDMQGTKALYLQEWAQEQGRGFLRFDYSGHGDSSEGFTDGTIGKWAADARVAINSLTTDRQILVGSSMGGWIALLLARELPERIAGVVGVAAAPDFTEDGMWAGFTKEQRQELDTLGRVELPSDYSDDPYVITRELIEDGRRQLVLRKPLNLPFPVRLLHGTADASVDMAVPLRLLDHAQGADIRLVFVKDADHSFSQPDNLRMIRKAIHSITMAV